MADEFLDALLAKCLPLLDQPGIGAPRDDIVPGLRVTFHGKYALYYMSDDEAVTLIRVAHGAQHIASIFPDIFE